MNVEPKVFLGQVFERVGFTAFPLKFPIFKSVTHEMDGMADLQGLKVICQSLSYKNATCAPNDIQAKYYCCATHRVSLMRNGDSNLSGSWKDYIFDWLHLRAIL